MAYREVKRDLKEGANDELMESRSEKGKKLTSSMTVPSLRVTVRALEMKRFSGSW